MTILSDWLAITARIRGIETASRLYLDNVKIHTKDADSIMQPILDNIESLKQDVKGYLLRHERSLRDFERETISNFLDAAPIITTARPTYYMLLERVIGLCSFESKFSYLMSDKSFVVRKTVERAFIHLNRALVVDSALQSQWQTAFDHGEPSVENLGGVHLLSHGIWGFKCHASGERTDLVLSQVEINLQDVERSVDGLVLTEWKVLKEGQGSNNVWEQAYVQAKLYGTGALAAIELRDTRFLVLVSKDRIAEPGDRNDDGVTYRHINIAIAPSSPSRQRIRQLGNDC